jgi:hypothetical protein
VIIFETDTERESEALALWAKGSTLPIVTGPGSRLDTISIGNVTPEFVDVVRSHGIPVHGVTPMHPAWG